MANIDIKHFSLEIRQPLFSNLKYVILITSWVVKFPEGERPSTSLTGYALVSWSINFSCLYK